MGRDKASLPYGGGTLAGRVAGAVRDAVGSAFLVGGAGAEVADLYPGEGPLGGILTVLHHTQADWNLVAACDMPGLTADFLRKLVDAAAHGEGDALIPAGPSGLLEPLCAVYGRSSREGLQRAFDRGIRKIATALEEVHAVTWHVADASCFANVNTPQDWAAYER